jgi:hypothetical protein
LLLAASACAALLTTRPAAAFRTIADGPNFTPLRPIRWTTDTITLVLSNQTTSVSTEDAVEALQSAASSWGVSCSTMRVEVQTSTSADVRPEDGINSVHWVDQGWAGLAQGLAQDPSVAAFTDVQLEKSTNGGWRIAEADIYLNAEAFSWSKQGGAGKLPIRQILLHEMGHVLGLLHPCGDADTPACSSDPVFGQCVMNPVYSESRGMLSPDDVAGACFLYPVSCTDDGCAKKGSGEPCAVDADCRPGLDCRAGVCFQGKAIVGAPCVSDADCASGACAGSCVDRCDRNADCETGATCNVDTRGVGRCLGRVKGFGSACSAAEQCASGKCILDDANAGVCTVSCASSDSCPSGWQCGDDKVSHVCVPQPNLSSCAIGRPVHQNYSFIAIVAYLAGVLRRRRSR